MSAQPRIACLGAGYWGKNLVRNFNELEALAAIAESNSERREQLAKEYPKTKIVSSHKEVWADDGIDAVAIATPAETHGGLVREALLAKKDVFVEKPLCLSVPEGQELLKLAASRNLILMVGHLLWYHPAILKLKEL